MDIIEFITERKETGPLAVGSYTPPDKDGNGEKIVRGPYGEGMVYKNDEAFYNKERPDVVCYIPELSDNKYTRQDLLDMCDGQEGLAEEVYQRADWQHPETILEDWIVAGEVIKCRKCGKVFATGGEESVACPFCGKAYQNDCM